MKDQVVIYHSWDEWLTALETTPLPAHWVGRNESSKTQGDPKWNGTKTLEDAFKLAREGWLAPYPKVEELAAAIETQVEADVFRTGFQRIYDVAGYEVDIDRYLEGEPECMIDAEPIRISAKGRAVRLLIPIATHGGVTGKQIEDRGAAVFALANLLARAQHPVEVWISSHVHCGGGHFTQHVKCQAANEPFDTGRLMFAIGNPATQRRLDFRGCEVLADEAHGKYLIGGYGRPEESDARTLPDQAENTIVLPLLSSGSEWEKTNAIKWIEAQLAGILGS